MKCAQCSSLNNTQFFVETISCKHCSERTDIVYHICSDCGMVWKTVNGQFLHGTTFSEEELTDVLSALEDSPVYTIESHKTTGTMEDVLHRCLRCDKIAHEVAKDRYKCSDCDFEWEVLTGD